MTVVADNALVEIAYTLKDDAGALLEASEDGPRCTYVHGQDQLLPAVEQALAGLSVGDEKELRLRPEQAYGYVDPDAVTEIPKDSLPPEALVPGTELLARRRISGETMFVTVKEVREDTVVLGLNHPFAGKTLHIHIRIIQIVPQPL